MENLTQETFKEKVFDFTQSKDWLFKGEKPAIIDFYADWCAPCKVVGPILEELETEYNGKVDFYKVNTENEVELSMVFSVQSIPALLFIPMGEQPQMTLGALPKSNLIQTIGSVLKVEK